MNAMFPVDDFFVRIRDKGGRLKLTVWDKRGEKLVSDFVSAASATDVWASIERVSSAQVVQAVRDKLLQ